MTTKLAADITTRPLLLEGEKAWPANLADLYERLKQDVAIHIPAGTGNLVVGPVQPTDVNTVWFRLSGAGNFQGIYTFVAGSWLNVGIPIGTLTWKKGRPDRFVNGTDGWWVCDGENGTNDFREMFRTLDGSAVSGGSANKTFTGLWNTLYGLVKSYHDATDVAAFAGTTAAEAAAYAKALRDQSDAVFEGLYTFMNSAEECKCADTYDATKVTAFLAEYKGSLVT